MGWTLRPSVPACDQRGYEWMEQKICCSCILVEWLLCSPCSLKCIVSAPELKVRETNQPCRPTLLGCKVGRRVRTLKFQQIWSTAFSVVTYPYSVFHQILYIKSKSFTKPLLKEKRHRCKAACKEICRNWGSASWEISVMKWKLSLMCSQPANPEGETDWLAGNALDQTRVAGRYLESAEGPWLLGLCIIKLYMQHYPKYEV